MRGGEIVEFQRMFAIHQQPAVGGEGEAAAAEVPGGDVEAGVARDGDAFKQCRREIEIGLIEIEPGGGIEVTGGLDPLAPPIGDPPPLGVVAQPEKIEVEHAAAPRKPLVVGDGLRGGLRRQKMRRQHEARLVEFGRERSEIVEHGDVRAEIEHALRAFVHQPQRRAGLGGGDRLARVVTEDEAAPAVAIERLGLDDEIEIGAPA